MKKLLLVAALALFASCQKEELALPESECYIIASSAYNQSDASATIHLALFGESNNPQSAQSKVFKSKQELDAFVKTFNGCKKSVTETYVK
jgi:uncharacterized lipoprotein YajG